MLDQQFHRARHGGLGETVTSETTMTRNIDATHEKGEKTEIATHLVLPPRVKEDYKEEQKGKDGHREGRANSVSWKETIDALNLWKHAHSFE